MVGLSVPAEGEGVCVAGGRCLFPGGVWYYPPPPPPFWTDKHVYTGKNITLPQLRLRAVKILIANGADREREVLCSLQFTFYWSKSDWSSTWYVFYSQPELVFAQSRFQLHPLTCSSVINQIWILMYCRNTETPEQLSSIALVCRYHRSWNERIRLNTLKAHTEMCVAEWSFKGFRPQKVSYYTQPVTNRTCSFSIQPSSYLKSNKKTPRSPIHNKQFMDYWYFQYCYFQYAFQSFFSMMHRLTSCTFGTVAEIAIKRIPE